ncbi:TPA: hypothetical protein U2R13_003940 [Providencia stuartii]|nr:hypothetical protein [Providencia stuartii]
MKIQRISRLKKFYDGNEDDFYKLTYSMVCPLCNENKIFRVLDLKSFRELDNQTRVLLIREIVKIEEKKLSTITIYGYDNLSVEYMPYICTKCKTEIIAVLAVGEWQPARYKIILLGVFKIQKNS